MTAGAYGAVQAGTYNTRALVPEVLVREGEWALVRPRIEVAELIAIDRLPAGYDGCSRGSNPRARGMQTLNPHRTIYPMPPF